MKKALLVFILFIFLFVLIYANTAITTDYRQGYFEPLNDSQQLVVDTQSLAIATLDFGENSPFNLVFYLGGYPEAGSTMNQNGYWFTWQPTGRIFCIWFIYK